MSSLAPYVPQLSNTNQSSEKEPYRNPPYLGAELPVGVIFNVLGRILNCKLYDVKTQVRIMCMGWNMLGEENGEGVKKLSESL